MNPTLKERIRGAVVDAVSAHIPRENVASVCRALLDDDDLPSALTCAYYGCSSELRTEDRVLDALAAHLEGTLGTDTPAALSLRVRAHELRIASMDKELRETQAALWRAERE